MQTNSQTFDSSRYARCIKTSKRVRWDIEDDVIIYANATILGGQTVIGKGAIIGGNTFITKSIAPGSVVTRDEVGKLVTRV